MTRIVASVSQVAMTCKLTPVVQKSYLAPRLNPAFAGPNAFVSHTTSAHRDVSPIYVQSSAKFTGSRDVIALLAVPGDRAGSALECV